MARLNIYLPDDLYELAQSRRGLTNLSGICARALREELVAADHHRSTPAFLEALRPPTALEREIGSRYRLTDVLIHDLAHEEDLRHELGALAARYLDRHIVDGALLAIAGGRQMWCCVRNISPRHVRISINALGFQQNDPRILHVHSNTLVTLLWLLYSPRSHANLIDSAAFHSRWQTDLPEREYPSYFVMASCSSFNTDTPFSQLIGDDATQKLISLGAYGDFAYVFLDRLGSPIDVTFDSPRSTFPSGTLEALAMRPDTRVLLVAGGEEKIAVMRLVLRAHLCNVLVTDSKTATELLELEGT